MYVEQFQPEQIIGRGLAGECAVVWHIKFQLENILYGTIWLNNLNQKELTK